MTLDVANALAVRARLARLHEGRDVVAPGGGDSAVDRHRAELFGEPVVGETAARGRVLVEWVGEPSPLDSPLLTALKLRGLLLPDERAVLRRASLLRKARVDGVTSRTLTAERDGYGETYRWGPVPGSYVRALTHADARRLFDDGRVAHEFRLLGEGAAAGPAVRPDAHWLGLINAARRQAGRAPIAGGDARLAVSYGPEMGLVRMNALARDGEWHPYFGR